jgi:hypothetical protein
MLVFVASTQPTKLAIALHFSGRRLPGTLFWEVPSRNDFSDFRNQEIVFQLK